MYLLDTNICIYAISGKYPKLREYLLTIPPDQVCISSVTVGEMEYGAAKCRWGEHTRHIMYAFLSNFSILPFTESDAAVFGRLRAHLAASGQPIGAYDVMIAAQALARNLTIVTHNTGEFSRVPGLLPEDWISP